MIIKLFSGVFHIGKVKGGENKGVKDLLQMLEEMIQEFLRADCEVWFVENAKNDTEGRIIFVISFPVF